MITFFKSIFKGMGYTVGKIIIFLILGILVTLFFNKNVGAYVNTGPFSDYVLSDTGNFWSLDSITSVSSHGYKVLSYDGYYYAVPTGSPFTYGVNGGALTQCGLPMLTGNYYYITYAFILSSDYLHPYYTNRSNHLSYSYSQGIYGTAFNYNFVSASVQISESPIYFPIGSNVGVFSIMFKAISDYDCLTINYSSSSHSLTTGESGFLGYKLTNLGTRPPTTGEIEIALKQDFENLQNSINNLNSTISAGASDIINNQNQNTNSIINNQNSNQSQTNSRLDNIENSITDESLPDTSSINGWASLLPAGPVDSIINMPLTILNSLLGKFNSSCTPVTLPIPLIGGILTLPCFSSFMSQYFSNFSLIWNLVGGIGSIIILYAYLMNLYKWVDNVLTLRENTNNEWAEL